MLYDLLRKSNLLQQTCVRQLRYQISLNIPCQRSLHRNADKWLPSEDTLLLNYVKHNGKKWTEFSQHCLPNRSPKQCQIRWTEALNPNVIKGPFSASEKELIKKGIATFGEGQWTSIRETFLPHRTARRIANEFHNWNYSKKPWTKEEDELLLKGIAQHGFAWSKITADFLPWRHRMQLSYHYKSVLDPDQKRGKWSNHELDLLLKRTIVFGQDWHKVAEGLPGRSPEACYAIWLNDLDPGLNKGPWSKEETRLFWERMHQCQGSFLQVAKGLPGRSRVSCARKFWSMIHKDVEFTTPFGEQLKQMDTENKREWKARVAKSVCHWLDQNIVLKGSENQPIYPHKLGPWDKAELLDLENKVNQRKAETKQTSLHQEDWKEIAKTFSDRDALQCRYQYETHCCVKDKNTGLWSKQEDDLLVSLIEQHGTKDWDIVVEQLPHRSKLQCRQRWQRVLKYQTESTAITKQKRLTEDEKSLIKEGVHMFGHNWVAIQETYLPTRTPEQLMRWWNYRTDRDEHDERGVWSNEEDEQLKFAVQSCMKEDGSVSSWRKIATMMEGRNSKQCRVRWLYSLAPDTTKGRWSYEEEMQLLEIVQKLKLQKSDGNIWPLVAKELNTGRTDFRCREKYNIMQRKGHRFAF